ncbi:MAG: methyl-accepting chemotaxis protein [Hungatella sp.]
MLEKMNLRNRLLASFSVILLLTVFISTLALTGLSNANKELNSFIEHALTADSSIKQCRIEANVAARTLRDMAIDPDTRDYAVYKEKINQNIQSIQTDVEALKKSYTKQDGLVAKYETALNNWIGIAHEIIAILERGDHKTAETMILTECTPALQGLIDIAKELNVTTTQMQAQALKTSQTDTVRSSILVLGFLVASIALGILLSVKVTASIVRPIQEVEHAAVRMSEGYLDTEIANTSKDEVGQLAESMRSSMKTLSTYIADIDRVMSEMAGGNFNVQPSQPFIGDFKSIEDSISHFLTNMSGTLRSIQQSSETVDSAAGQVSASSQALAQGATEQASEVDTLSASIAHIATQAKDNAKNAGIANDLAGNVASEIASSDEKMQHLIGAMNEISSSSNEIGKIIKAIEDIAFQTNILALNAAVEAARAGEAGKGFAVVADEVRNLAAKSAEAAKNTTELIQSSVRAVANGTGLADDTAKNMGAVVSGAQSITELIGKISIASNEQADSSAQITRGIDQIASVVQTNSATAEESAAASEELSGQAQVLKNLVEGFRLLA